MMECSRQHDYIYYGALNIYVRRELIRVIDAWRCRVCGKIKVGYRGPEVLTSTEGLLPEASPGKHWVLLVCKAGRHPVDELHQVSDRDFIEHRCPASSEPLYYVKDKGVFLGVDGPPATNHYVYDIARTVRGYIDVSKTPPEVVTLLR